MSVRLRRVNAQPLVINDGKVDITDPCYHRDVWCRINDLDVMPGQYQCYFYHGNCASWGDRVWILGIEHVDTNLESAKWKRIGEIGVDAGLAGFFNHKPDYSDEEWDALCIDMDDAMSGTVLNQLYSVYGSHNGFWSQSGCGDGSYFVYAKRNDDGRIAALEIRF